jgi:3-hydroxyisobutyrate dehydrogenase-like beta-hydroxyacid dehydrogenase
MGADRTVAVLGTGRMGGAFVRKLAEAGCDLVVYNRTPATAEALAADVGATGAPTAREAAAAVVLEMSTIDPGTLEDIAPWIAAAGAALVDAPVSGSVALVEQGALTVMAGGSAEAVEAARPVLEALAARIYHVGGRGAGATMKLAVNAVVHAVNVAVAEALVLAEAAGVDRATAYEVFANSAAASPFITYKQRAFLDPDGTPVAFSLDLVAKDLDLILGLAERTGVEMDQGVANRTVTGKAIGAGLGERDMSTIAVYLRQ